MSSISLSISPTYEHIVVKGLPYARGFSHGQQLEKKIKRNIVCNLEGTKALRSSPSRVLLLKVITDCETVSQI